MMFSSVVGQRLAFAASKQARFVAPSVMVRHQISRSFAAVGDKMPSVELHKGFPPHKVNMADYTKDKKVILVGLPGAFTPT